MKAQQKHAFPTVIGVAALAFIASDLSHEALGHASAALLTQAKSIVLSYTYLSTDLGSKWISAAGPLATLLEGLIAALALCRYRFSPALTLFVFLLAAFDLLNAAAYLVYSGATDSGDLAVVVLGWPFASVIRVVMIVLGLGCYWLTTLYLGHEAARFEAPRERFMFAAYGAPIILMAGAALFNPLGMRLYLISALPASALANLALLWIPRLAEGRSPLAAQLSVPSRPFWVLAGLSVSAAFILIVGPGITLRG